MKLAALLLLVWYAVHYGYQWAPAQQGAVFNVLRSAGSLVLLSIVFLALPSRVLAVPAAGLAAEELQVIGCGTWWLLDPWPVKPGDELCSAGLGFPLGAVGLAVLGVAAWHLKNKGERHGRSEP